MSRDARLLFDECLGKPAIENLASLASRGKGERVEIRHVEHYFAKGTPDEVWIPQIAPEGWTVITTDGGKGGRKKGEKLPKLCAIHVVTHVILGPKVHGRSGFEKLLTVLDVWYPLLEIARADPGDRWSLQAAASGERGRGRLVRAIIPEDLLALRSSRQP